MPVLEGNCGSPEFSSCIQAVVTRVGLSDFLGTGGQMMNDVESPFFSLKTVLIRVPAEPPGCDP